MAKGLLIVYTGASGVGKGTIMKQLLAQNSNFRLSVSVTTRAPRPGETDGVEYSFVSKETFLDLIQQDGLMEYTQYCDNFYGTPKKQLFDMLENGYDVFLEIEVEGFLQIKEKYPDCVTIFILPPSIDVLRHRLTKRGTEPIDVIEQRLAQAQRELTFAEKFDYQVVNDDYVRAANEIINIVKIIKKDK